ncbi:DNA-binding protein Ets97D-like isoform X2 [Cotesia typhae]
MMQIDTQPGTVFSHDQNMRQLQQKISDLKVEPNSPIKRFHQDTRELGIYSQLMDIREPLSTLKKLLQHKLNFDLKGFQFWLLDTQLLERHRILVGKSFQSRGLVEINVQINRSYKRINIVNVLKPH